ncbi:MAG TPA: NUDIX hydrolase [Solirubrobacteraceae bacterium]|nr:NUDIX hydrolase [Solirubrobacteraceae bacterium]
MWSRVVRPDARGVKCVLRDDAGRALFVRHAYGDRRRWEIPGGGARGGEALAEAARREAFEELGADVRAWEEVGTARGLWYGKEERLTVFAAPWPGGPVRPDPVEIATVGWFALADPPSPLGPTTVAALELLRR